MTNIYFITTVGLAMFALLEAVIILVIFARFPSLLALLTSKRIVWEIAGDGNMIAAKAKAYGGALKTRSGVYFYERLDVVNFHNIPGIIVNMASDAKAIRPDIQPVLSLMKKLNISNRERFYALFNAPLYTQEQYKRLLARQEEQAA